MFQRGRFGIAPPVRAWPGNCVAVRSAWVGSPRRGRMSAGGRRRPGAFTLVETLIALGIMAILVTAMAAAIDAMLRQPALLRAGAEARGAARMAVQRIAAELREARVIHSIIDHPDHQRIVFAAAADPAQPAGPLEAFKIQWHRPTGALTFGWAEEYGADGAPLRGRSVDLLEGCTRVQLAYEGEFGAAAGHFQTAAGIFPAAADLSSGGVRVRTITIDLETGEPGGGEAALTGTVHCPHAPSLAAYSTEP